MARKTGKKGVPLSMDYEALVSTYDVLVTERSEWEAEWRNLSDYLLPGRGLYTLPGKQYKRSLSSPKLINTIGTDSLNILSSGFHGGLTSPNRNWITLEWANPIFNRFPELKMWIQEAGKVLHRELHDSNFYSVIQSFYPEHAGFGTGSLFVGENKVSDSAFHFELLTVGEFAFSIGPEGVVDTYFRIMLMSTRRVVEEFGIENVSSALKSRYENNFSEAEKVDVPVLCAVVPEPFLGKKYTQVYYEYYGGAMGVQSWRPSSEFNYSTIQPLRREGFHEMPYFVARWDVIGSDVYGVGLGSRVLPDIRRLQEMEKSFLKGVHKAVDPPVNAPARLRGMVQTMPGGITYYSNPNDKISELYSVRVDFQGVSAAIERVEQRVQRSFFVDIFLTAARDPNASPLKATEANIRENEKLLRLGPVIERLQHELFRPMLTRCFNILLRKGKIPKLPKEMEKMTGGEYNIRLVGPLAHAQKQLAMQGITSFLGFVANAATLDQRVMDKIDIDRVADEIADITGVSQNILATDDEVAQKRQARAQAQAQAREAQAQEAGRVIDSRLNLERAQAAKAQSEAGVNYSETIPAGGGGA